MLLVELIVVVGDELLLGARIHPLGLLARDHLRRELGELPVQVGGGLRLAGDDQRRARLVDEDVVDLVDDGEVMHRDRAAVRADAAAVLDLLLQRLRHIVAQIVKAELGVRAVGDVASVGGDLLLVGLHVLQHADGHSTGLVDRHHPLGVTLGQVVVDRDHMDTLTGERVEDDRKGAGEGLAFTGLHLGDLAAMEDHAADQLDVEMAHLHRAPADLADDREALGEHFLKLGGLLVIVSVAHLFAQVGHALEELFVGLEFEFRLEGVDARDALLIAIELLRLSDIQRAIKQTHA